MFPNLTEELEKGDAKISIGSVRTDTAAAEKTHPDRFRNYNPTIIDFMRRCDTQTEVESIITFMEKRGEINGKHAEKLRLQLGKKGVRSFGPKKGDDYYSKHGGLC